MKAYTHGARWTRGVVLLCAALGLSPVAHAEEMLRIAVAKAKDDVVVSGPGLQVLDAGEAVFTGTPVKLAPADDGILVNGRKVATERLDIRGTGALNVRTLSLDGSLEVHLQRRGGRPSLVLVHEVPIEAYVAATVSSEMPTSWPIESLKAQAVATRTFAVFRKFNAPDRPYHMESTVVDQVYGGAGRVAKSALRATRETRGEVLTYKRRPIRAYFHSCCAGRTESAREGWGQNLRYLPSVTCSTDRACPAFHYRASIPTRELAAALRRARLKVHRITAVRVEARSKTGRVQKLRLDTDGGPVHLSGEDLRRLVGYNRVKSRSFDIELRGGVLNIRGQGSGHGVGMCQWGARGMAVAHKNYRQILAHYYPHTSLQRMY